MNRYATLSLLSFLLLAGNARAEEPALPAQLAHIEALQRRADKLGFGKMGEDNYHLAKARTWLDLALSEYYENETTGIVPAAAAQAEFLLDALEKKQADIPMDTPVKVDDSEAVRPDLWEKIAALKNSGQFSCGQRPAAEAEVYLVWAGHEKFESNWEHAQSYARNAEELINRAGTAIERCTATYFAQMPVLEKITLTSDATFAFGSAKLDKTALWRLNRMADSIKQDTRIEAIELVGHTDRLRGSGNIDRNQALSEQRAESIKQYLAGKGIQEDKIHASGAGSSRPLVQCSPNKSKAKQIECLKPNRRVEIILHGTR